MGSMDGVAETVCCDAGKIGTAPINLHLFLCAVLALSHGTYAKQASLFRFFRDYTDGDSVKSES